jgi:hypothetical protein
VYDSLRWIAVAFLPPHGQLVEEEARAGVRVSLRLEHNGGNVGEQLVVLCIRVCRWLEGVDAEGAGAQRLESTVCCPYAACAMLVPTLLGDEEGVVPVAVIGAGTGIVVKVDVWRDEVEGPGEAQPISFRIAVLHTYAHTWSMNTPDVQDIARAAPAGVVSRLPAAADNDREVVGAVIASVVQPHVGVER